MYLSTLGHLANNIAVLMPYIRLCVWLCMHTFVFKL